MEPGEVVVGNWRAIPQKGGTYLYKANDVPTSLSKAKPAYKEKPQYPLIVEYESVAKNRCKEELSVVVKDIVKFLIKTQDAKL
jgi:hypothetical protein